MTKPEIDAEGLDRIWSELVEKDDRTSPTEYPDMVLITREELAHYLAATRTRESEEPVAVKIDREALRKRIENDPDEGEIGAGFEMFTPEAVAALERLAFAALPRWAQDELTALRAAPHPSPVSEEVTETVRNVISDLEWVHRQGGLGYRIHDKLEKCIAALASLRSPKP